MMFEFEVNGALSRRQRDFLDLFLPRNLVDLSDVLSRGFSPSDNQLLINTHLTNEAIQERLPNLMAMCVPIQAMSFTERVELLHILRRRRNQMQKKRGQTQLTYQFVPDDVF
jgi:hypothetical protein